MAKQFGRYTSSLTALVAAWVLAACGVVPVNVYTNDVDPRAATSVEPPAPAASAQASFRVRAERRANDCETAGTPLADPKRQKDTLVLLALSGGGSRAALFSSQVMLQMQKMTLQINGEPSNLLNEVDAISSVSGGSLPAAYYAISHDPGQDCAAPSHRVWDDETVTGLMKRNYLGRWLGNLFWPSNIVQFWLTAYDRTDIMAQTLSDNLYDKVPTGMDLSLSQLNPLRPNLILNATVGSRSDDGRFPFGAIFTFTAEDFGRIASNVDTYSVGRAVMATATFPGAFNFMTLCDYGWNKDRYQTRSCHDRDDPRYLHVFDGGNADNLGLTGLKRVIWSSIVKSERPHIERRKIVVILVDSFINSRGADPKQANPRGAFDYLVDTNFIDATDSLLESNRRELIGDFSSHKLFPFGAEQLENGETCRRLLAPFGDEAYCDRPAQWWKQLNADLDSKLIFRPIDFAAIGEVAPDAPAAPRRDSLFLRGQLAGIPTNFKLPGRPDAQTGLEDADAITCATPLVFGQAVTPSCGALRPAVPAIAQRWGEVRCALETPAAACR
jgi:predicted acylesterase/phospholipase RssA